MKLTPADKSLLITFTGASLLVLVFFFLGVKPYENTEMEEAFIEIPVLENLPEASEQENAQPKSPSKKFRSNRAYNSRELQNEARELFKEDDVVRKAIETGQLQSVESLMSETEKALEAQKKSQELALAERKEIIKAQIEARERQRNNRKGNRESTVSYDLVGREAVVIPNPVYTCDAQGTIVIDITVNSRGGITEMTYNKKTSTSSNGCLIDQALEYTQQALFDAAQTISQKGSITFYFQG